MYELLDENLVALCMVSTL